jgi:drug/metabolite transporter (DMT)-like permease
MMKWRGLSLSFSIKGNIKYVFGAALADSMGTMCFMIAISLAPITVVAPIVAAHPLVTITCARVFDGEETSRMQSVGILLTLGGLILLGLLR